MQSQTTDYFSANLVQRHQSPLKSVIARVLKHKKDWLMISELLEGSSETSKQQNKEYLEIVCVLFGV